MSMISDLLAQILSARYGKDVRQSIHDAIEEIDEIAEGAKDSAKAYADKVEEIAETLPGRIGINDETISDVTTWSSKKINESASGIDDTQVTTEKTWSSSKIANEIDDSTKLFNAVGEVLEIDTAKGGIRFNKVVGKTYKSKNLLKPTLQTTTTNGVTCTNNGDGTYTLNGTATNDSYFGLGNIYLNSGTYKFVASDNNLVRRRVRQGSIQVAQSTSDVEFTATENEYNFQIVAINGKTYNNDVVKPMLTTDLTATYDDFEPFGVFNSGEHGWFDGEFSNGAIDTTDGHIGNQKDWQYFPTYIKVNPNDTVNIKEDDVRASGLRLAFYDEDKNFLRTASATTTTYKNFILTVPSDVYFIRFSYYGANYTTSSDVCTNGVVVTINGQYAEVIKEQGKNLWETRDVSITSNGIKTVCNKKTQRISASGTINTTWFGGTETILKFLPKGTYTFTISDPISAETYIRFYKVGGGNVDKKLSPNKTSITFELTDDVKSFYVFFAGFKSGDVVSINDLGIMLVKGADDISYQPYTEITTFLPLTEPLYQDNVVDKDGVHKKFACVDLGSLSWAWQNDWKAWYSVNVKDYAKPKDNDVIVDFYSDNYITTSVNNIISGNSGIALAGTSYTIVCKNNSSTDKPSGKIYYPLETPTTEPLTLEQTKALNSLVSFADKTHIDTADEYAKATLDVDYGQSGAVAKALEANNNAEIISALESSLAQDVTNRFIKEYNLANTSFNEAFLKVFDENYANYKGSINCMIYCQSLVGGSTNTNYVVEAYKHSGGRVSGFATPLNGDNLFTFSINAGVVTTNNNFNELNQKLVDFGEATRIARYTSFNTTIDIDLSDYRYLYIEIDKSSDNHGTLYIPTNIITATSRNWYISRYTGSTYNYEIRMTINNTSFKAEALANSGWGINRIDIYGVK